MPSQPVRLYQGEPLVSKSLCVNNVTQHCLNFYYYYLLNIFLCLFLSLEVLISTFSTDEVRAWVDLGESESFPSLYLFRLEGNKVVFHMEKLENGEMAVEFSPRVFLHRQRKSTLMKDHLQETTLVKDHPQKTTLMKHHPQKTTLKKDHHAKTTLIKGHPQKTTLLKDYPQKTPI